MQPQVQSLPGNYDFSLIQEVVLVLQEVPQALMFPGYYCFSLRQEAVWVLLGVARQDLQY